MTCVHGHVGRQPTSEAVSFGCQAAAAMVSAAGQRMTGPRRRVLELLLTSSRPEKAYDLIAAFHTDQRIAKPATVYRALEFLNSMGLVHRLSSSKCYVACTLGMAAHSAAFLICDCCGSCREISAPEAASLSGTATALGYSVDRVTIEAEGRCPACRVTTGE